MTIPNGSAIYKINQIAKLKHDYAKNDKPDLAEMVLMFADSDAVLE